MVLHIVRLRRLKPSICHQDLEPGHPWASPNPAGLMQVKPATKSLTAIRFPPGKKPYPSVGPRKLPRDPQDFASGTAPGARGWWAIF